MNNNDFSRTHVNLQNSVNDITDNIYSVLRIYNINVFQSDAIKKDIADFIKYWDNELEQAINNSSAVNLNNTDCVLKSSEIKYYIFNNFDYAGILQFVDGLIKDPQNILQSSAKIAEYEQYVISSILKKNLSTISSIVDDVNGNKNPDLICKVNDTECSEYEMLRKFQGLRKMNYAMELKVSINNIIDMIYEEQNNISIPSRYSIIRVINITLAHFATRCYAITMFLRGYDSKNEITESVVSNEVRENPNLTRPLYTKDLNVPADIKLQSYHDYTRVHSKIAEFMKNVFNTKPYNNITSQDGNNDNAPPKPIIELNKSIREQFYRMFVDTEFGHVDNSLEETVLRWEEFQRRKFNPHIQHATDTITDIDGLKKNLLIWESISKVLYDWRDRMESRIQSSMRITDSLNPNENNLRRRVIYFIDTFYLEYTTSFIKSVMNFEERQFFNNVPKTNSIGHMDFNLQDPWDNKNAPSLIDWNQLSNDNSLKMENYEFEILMSEYKDISNFYISMLESSSDEFEYKLIQENALSDAFNVIKAAIESLIKLISDFRDNKKFKDARQWLSDKQENILDHNPKGSIDHIPFADLDPVKIIDHINSALNNFNAEAVVDKDKQNEFIKQLYYNDHIFNIFDKGGDNTKEAFVNYILYGSTDGNKPSPKSISGNELKTNVKKWVDTVNVSDAVLNKFKTKASSISSASNSIYNKLKSKDQSDEDKMSSTYAEILNRINRVLTNIILPLRGATVTMTTDSYKYIKDYWALMQSETQKQSTDNASENNTDSNPDDNSNNDSGNENVNDNKSQT